MSVVKKLEAKFSADAALLFRTFRQIQTEAGRLGPAVQQSTQTANRSFNDLGSNAQRLQARLRDAGNVPAFAGLNASAEQAQREIEATGRVSAATMARLQQEVSGAGDHFNSLGADARQGFSDVESIINSVRGDLDRLNQADLDRLRREADQASNNLDEVGDAARQAEQDLNNLNSGGGLNDAADEADSLAGSLGSLAGGAGGGVIGAVGAGFLALTGLVGGFIAVGAGIYGFVKSSDELKRATNALQTQTGATNTEIKGMRDSLVNIYGNNFGENFQDIADSMANVKQQTNLSGAELETFTQNALMMRDTFEYDVAESTKAASILMKQFGIDGDEAMALIADGTQNGLNYADDLLDSIGEYSVYYEQAGFSAQEMFGMFKNAQESGAFNIDYAADAFKEFGIIMTEDSDRAKSALERIGLPAGELIEDFSKGGESARGAFETIAKKLGEVEDPLDRTQIGIELFGTKFEDLGADAVIAMSKTNDSITGTQDKLDAINAVKYDTVGEAITGVGRKLVANILIPLQDRIMPGVNTSINKFLGFINTASDAIGAFIKGDESGENLLKSYGMEPEQFQPLIGMIGQARSGFQSFKEGAGAALGAIGASIKSALIDAWPIVLKTIQIAVEFVRNNLSALSSFWRKNGEEIMGHLSKIADSIQSVFVTVWPPVRRILQDVAAFIMEIFGKIQKFWFENGTQILEAITNIFTGIMKVVEFVMPAVLGIIKMVWQNIKGVITGALDIIMGAVKIFSGLFTGDFGKMWEGVKQLFIGAVTFVWNFVQLTFFGKILSGAKAFVLGFRTFFVSMWQAITALFSRNVLQAQIIFRTAWATIQRNTTEIFGKIVAFFKNTWASLQSITSGFTSAMRLIFTNGFQAIRNKISEIFLAVFRFLRTTMGNIRTTVGDAIRNTVTAARNTWNTFKTNTLQAFRDVYNGIKARFTNIVDAAKALPGRIGEGIRMMAGKVTSGITTMINTMARTLGKGINGVISGVNTVLDKIGVNTEIDPWKVPQWAKGTPHGGHPGGPAIINDGTGTNAGPELVKTPDGKMQMYKGKNLMVNLPEGTQVLSATKTRKFLQSIPAYNWGTDLFEGAVSVGKKTVGAIKTGASAVKDWTINAFDYIKNPGKLLDLALSKLGIDRPSAISLPGKMARGAFDMVKKGAISMVKKSLDVFAQDAGGPNGFGAGGGGTFGGQFRKSSSYGWRTHPITKKRTFHNGDDWAAPAGTIIPNQAAGIVSQSAYHPIRGNYVRIRSGNYERIYQHNTRNLVRAGQTVQKGQAVGTVGSTGSSTGPHLHYELLKNGNYINPTSLLGNKGGMGGEGIANAARGFATKVNKYKDGGVALSKQLAWLADGGWAESVISHDPAKKASQMDLWNKTGETLGFSSNNLDDRILQILERIAKGVESDSDRQIIMNDRVIGQMVERYVSEQQALNKDRQTTFNGRGGRLV